LIEAFSDAEDPVALLVASAQEHIPLNTAGLTGAGELLPITDPEKRQSIEGIIEELQEQNGYMQQIKYRRTFDAIEGSLGGCGENNLREYLDKM
jgi:DEAD/DEAH box helicase domain-containing protein